MTKVSTDDFLAHYGVKGMKWGKRKAETSGSPRLSRKEFRAKVKAEKRDFYEAKSKRILKEALDDPDVLIALKGIDPYPTIVTGKEYITHLGNGGLFDVRLTDVYARKTSDGPYELNEQMNVQYKKPKR